ncbi:hypothetical protein Ndes2526A_g00314 [Nannochloris sp. 'desiccata']
MKVTASYCLPKCSKASLGPLYTLYCQHVKTNHVETTPISFTKFCSIMSAEAVKAPKRRIPNTFEEPKNGFVNISALNVAEEASRVKDDEAATFFFKSFQDVLFGSKSQINTPKPTSHHQSTVLVTEDKENDNSTTTTATTTKAIAAVDVVAADNVIAPGPQPKEPKTVPTLASNATEFTFPKLQPVTTAPFPPTAAGKVFRSKSTPQAQEGVLDSEISTKLAPVVKNTFTFNINAPDFVLPDVTSLRASATTTPTVTSSKLHPAAHEFVFPAMSTQPHSSVKPTMRASALNPNAKGYTRPYQMTSSASAPLFENAAKAVISPVVISTTKFSPDVLATMDVDSLYELSLKAFKMKDFNGRFYPAHIFDPAGIVATRLRERNTAGTILVLQPFAANECLSPKERTYWAVHTIECIEHADFFGLRGTEYELALAAAVEWLDTFSATFGNDDDITEAEDALPPRDDSTSAVDVSNLRADAQEFCSLPAPAGAGTTKEKATSSFALRADAKEFIMPARRRLPTPAAEVAQDVAACSGGAKAPEFGSHSKSATPSAITPPHLAGSASSLCEGDSNESSTPVLSCLPVEQEEKSFEKMVLDAQLRSVDGDVELLERQVAKRRAEDQAAAEAHAVTGRATFDLEAAERCIRERHQELIEEAATAGVVSPNSSTGCASTVHPSGVGFDGAALGRNLLNSLKYHGSGGVEHPGAAAGRALLAMLKSGTTDGAAAATLSPAPIVSAEALVEKQNASS